MTDNANDEPLSSDVRDLVPQKHGGAINRAGKKPTRLISPTVADVAARSSEYLYKIVPRIARIANNREKRDKKAGTSRRPYKVADQVRAAGVLARFAALDRTLREARVQAALSATREEILIFLPREQADALMQKIAPHWTDV